MADAPAGGGVKPPGYGEALGKGFEAFKANAVPLILCHLVGMIVMYIPIAGWVMMSGLFYVSLKAVRGQKPEIGDVFIGFKDFVNHLIMNILAMIGVVACYLGIFVTYPLFHQGIFLLVDKGMKWGEAKDKCMAEVKPNLVPWIIFSFVCLFVGGIGSVLFGIGALITWPICNCALAYAYDKTLGGGGGAAPKAA